MTRIIDNCQRRYHHNTPVEQEVSTVQQPTTPSINILTRCYQKLSGQTITLFFSLMHSNTHTYSGCRIWNLGFSFDYLSQHFTRRTKRKQANHCTLSIYESNELFKDSDIRELSRSHVVAVENTFQNNQNNYSWNSNIEKN